MSLENLWNHQYWVAVIDIWGKWTNLMTWWSLVHLQTAFEMDKEAIFPPSGIYHSNTVVILTSCGSKLSHWLFRVMVMSDLILETGRVPRTRITRQERQSPSISQLNRLDTRYNKQSNRTEIQVFRMQHWIVCYNILRYITPTCIPEDQLAQNWKSRAYRHK